MNKYCLHDTYINRISVFENGIIMEFDDGVYNLNQDGEETFLTSKCIIRLSISDFNCHKPYQHIQIYKNRKFKRDEITLEKLQHLLESSSYDIDNSFWATFDNTLLLIGYVGNFNIEFFISDIENISYEFC